MNSDYTALCAPGTGTPLVPDGGCLVDTASGKKHPIVAGIPRFVPKENYAADFGLQWIKFQKTQLDSYTKTSLTRDRLARCFNGHLSSLRGKLVLEAGSGAGRFSEILLAEGAKLHSCDLSSAVEANAANNGHSDDLLLVQGDITKLPFHKNTYDYVMCLGVLQHTPSPEESIACLYEMAKPGGYLILDHYIYALRHVLPPPIGNATLIYRKIISSLAQEKRLNAVKKIVDFWFPIHWWFKDSLLVQRLLRRISPVHFYYPHMALPSKELYYEWAFLDTHDATTDYYKHLRTALQIERYLKSLGAVEVKVWKGGNGVEAFCRKPL